MSAIALRDYRERDAGRFPPSPRRALTNCLRLPKTGAHFAAGTAS